MGERLLDALQGSAAMNMNIYLSKQDKQRLEELQALLKERGIVHLDNRGNDSISALFRALVKEKLEDIKKKNK